MFSPNAFYFSKEVCLTLQESIRICTVRVSYVFVDVHTGMGGCAYRLWVDVMGVPLSASSISCCGQEALAYSTIDGCSTLNDRIPNCKKLFNWKDQYRALWEASYVLG